MENGYIPLAKHPIFHPQTTATSKFLGHHTPQTSFRTTAIFHSRIWHIIITAECLLYTATADSHFA
jgi:hypothetical protein